MLANVSVRSEKAAEHLALLTDAVRAFADAATDTDRLVDTIAHKMALIVGDSCAVLLRAADGQSLVPAAVRGRSPEIEVGAKSFLSQSAFRLEDHVLVKQVMESGVALLVPKLEAMAGQARESSARYVAETGTHSVLVVPLRARGEPLGVMGLTRMRPEMPSFDETDRDLAVTIGDHAALALANARSYQAEREARAAAERALAAQRLAEGRFARLADSGVVGIVTARMDGKILEINDALLDMIGRTREEITSGKVPWATLTPPEWRHVDRLAVKQIVETGIGELREKELLRSDGGRVPVLIGTALAEGTTEATSFVLDLTDRKQAEEKIAKLEAARAAETKFRALLEAAPDAMVIIDEQRKIVLVNAEAEVVFGWNREEMIGKPIEIIIAPSHRHLRSGPGERRLAFTMRGLRKNGEEFPADVRRSPIVTEEGTLLASSIRDVTERIREAALLVRSKESAESANRELESFSYSVAHDLRTPLRGINGFAQVLSESNGHKLDDEGTLALGRITAASKRMAALIDALLSIAQFSRAELRRVSLDMSEIAQAVVTRIGGRVGTEVVIHPHMRAEGDPMLIAAVLDNLVGNAFKFTEKKPSARIEVGIVKGSKPPVFFVKDDGVGFDTTYAHKLFAPFQRLHGLEEFPGTGVGLATVQRIVQRHGGRAWAESVLGESATFFFSLTGATLEGE